jgi:acyl-CoA thioesterase FadM
MSNSLFLFRTHVRFHQADPAGIMFFGHVGALAHDAYEGFVGSLGFTYSEWFENPEWAVPIRRTTCDYLRPMPAGLELTIVVGVEKIGETSFTLTYSFHGRDNVDRHDETFAKMQIVHSFIDKKTRAKFPIPSVVRGKLEAYQGRSVSAK